MKRNKEQSEKVFTTLDAYTAGYLYLNNFTPELTQQGNKVVFVFPATEELYRELTRYNTGATVEASRFAGAIKNLKSQIFSLRRNKDKWDTPNGERNFI